MNFVELIYEDKKKLLAKLPRKQIVLFACDCARLVLPFWEKECPKDQRPLKAIEAAENYALNDADADDAARAAVRVADAANSAWTASADAARAAFTAWAAADAAVWAARAARAAWAADDVTLAANVAQAADWAAWAASDVTLTANVTQAGAVWAANDTVIVDEEIKAKINFLYDNMTLTKPETNENISNLVRFIKINKDFAIFPILEDALEDVGYRTGRNGVYGLSHMILNLENH